MITYLQVTHPEVTFGPYLLVLFWLATCSSPIITTVHDNNETNCEAKEESDVEELTLEHEYRLRIGLITILIL